MALDRGEGALDRFDRGEVGRGTLISQFPQQSCGVHVFSLALVDCELGGLVRACTDAPGAETRCTAPTFSDPLLWPLSDPHPGTLRDGRLVIGFLDGREALDWRGGKRYVPAPTNAIISAACVCILFGS